MLSGRRSEGTLAWCLPVQVASVLGEDGASVASALEPPLTSGGKAVARVAKWVRPHRSSCRASH